MKKYLPFIIGFVISQQVVFPQGCLPDGITFNTQDEVDLFQANNPGCTEIEGNVIISGADITSLDGLGVLHSIGGNLRIEQNDSLVNLLGLENLSHINGDLIIGDIAWGKYPYSTGNPLLTSMAGLNSLVSIQGNLKLCGNYSLVTLSGLEHLAHIGGNLQLGGIEFVYGFTFGNPQLVNLNGFTRLSAIGGGLFVAGNNNLADLSGLDSLASVGQHCWFDLNESLTSLHGLDRLTSIGGSLKIRWNNVLSDISGLEHITSQSIQDLEIIYNQTLAECSIESICGYLEDPLGIVEIYGNAPGCNNPEEVTEACLTPVEEADTGTSFTIIPNPSEDKITASLPAITGIIRLTIFTVNGQKALEKQLTDNEIQLDISALPQGVYVVRVQDEKSSAVIKLIKE